jgi:hypothetical protein
MRRFSCRFGWAVLATILVSAGAANAAVLTIEGSPADYEPRLTRPTTSQPGEGLAIDTNVNTPSDAANLRIGGQARFRIGTAYFFALPTLAPGETIYLASLRFTQIPDSAATGVRPTFNADLRAVGIFSDISVAHDPQGTQPQINPSLDPSLSSLLYGDAEDDTRAAVGTTVPRFEIHDNFLVPDFYIANGGTNATRTTGPGANLLFANYLNTLYAAGVPSGSYLVVTLNPDAPPDDVNTNRYQVASANATDASQRPALTVEIVPEPSAAGLLVLAGTALVARRRRRA